MSHTKINQKLIVPLFNVEVNESLELTLTDEEFVERLTFYLLAEPITVVSRGVEVERNGSEPTPPATPIPIPTPKTTIHIFPWGRNQSVRDDLKKFVKSEQLPSDFDIFDNLGPIAFRAGSGGLGGFQTVTAALTKKDASALLMIDFDQPWAEDAQALPSGGVNPYEYRLIDSFLDGLRLSTGNEPHQHKGFHLVDGQFIDSIIKWPLMEIQGPPIRLVEEDVENIRSAFLLAWHVRTNAEESTSCRILNLALEYYYLSSTMTETRTIFLHLMIAFESLFKAQEEGSASVASSRLARLLAATKEENNEIRRFMWNTKESPGCCQIRNQIVHGSTTSLSNHTYWKLRRLIRLAIVRLGHLVHSVQIDGERYYESLNEHVTKRFEQLPNK